VTLSDQQRATRRTRLPDGHPDSAEWWIDIERIRGNAVAHPALLAIEQVGGDDLEWL